MNEFEALEKKEKEYRIAKSTAVHKATVLRKQHNVSQQHVADSCGVSLRTYVSFENYNDIHDDTFKKIINYWEKKS